VEDQNWDWASQCQSRLDVGAREDFEGDRREG